MYLSIALIIAAGVAVFFWLHSYGGKQADEEMSRILKEDVKQRKKEL